MAGEVAPWDEDYGGGETAPWDEDYGPTPEPMTEKDKLRRRVGPPTMGDEAILNDIPALTPLGYAASEVPIAGPLVKSAIGKFSPQTEEELNLGKARYEQENPKTAAGLQLAAPLALPMGPAKLGAQALYQGAIGAGDALARGESMDEAEATGALTTGATIAMGKAGKVAAPLFRKAGDLVDKVPGKVADYLRGKAANRAADAALSGQKKLNSGLSEGAKRNVGEAMLDTPGMMNRHILGDSPKGLAAKAAAAEKEANGEITRLIDDLTAQGVNPTRQQVLGRINALQRGKERTPDTEAFHSYLDKQAEYIASVPDERFTLRFLQNLKNDVPYDRLAESTVKKVRKAYKGALQETQDEVVESTGEKAAYKGMQKRASGLIDAAKGTKERADRAAANRSPSLTDYLTGGAGLVAGAALGSGGGQDLSSGAVGGVLGAGALGALNRFGRSRGSSMAAANLNTLSKMVRTKFGPMLEEAAKRGKGAMSVTHYLLYRNDPEYRKLYDSQSDGSENPTILDEAQ